MILKLKQGDSSVLQTALSSALSLSGKVKIEASDGYITVWGHQDLDPPYAAHISLEITPETTDARSKKGG